MEIDVNALQELQEAEPEAGLYPCTGITCDWTCIKSD
ncbi:MAG: hypothetical protein QOC94_1090 [Actinoplanes sp.]|nr:hypothetical protein [Actinoplanes sp.]